MANKNRAFVGLAAFFLVLFPMPTLQASEPTIPVSANASETTAYNSAKAPIVIEADELYYNETTGELFAKGEVKITRDGSEIISPFISGNTKQTMVWADEATFLQEPETMITGYKLVYNYDARTGTMQNFTGRTGPEIVAGEDMDISPDKLVFANGMITRCPAKVPDYKISADKIEVWPGEKIVLHHARFWLKNFILFTLPKYQVRLTESNTQIPQVGYDSDNGLYVQQYLESPLSKNFAAYANVGYFTKHGFRYSAGLVDRNSNYDLRLMYGYEKDDDDRWIRKEPELMFAYHEKQLGKLPYSYSFSAAYGKWNQNDISNWHQEYELYIKREPINIGNSTQLYLGGGWELIKESYDNSEKDILKLDATMHTSWSPKLATWVGYHYRSDKSEVFDFNQPELARERVLGLSYRFDDKNAVSYQQRYDMDNHRSYEDIYTWIRDLHCWTAKISYEDYHNGKDDDRIKFSIEAKVW